MFENIDLTDYRPIPFWSWNDKLEEKHLREQIQDMNKKGIGGFFMHARGGLETEYMSDEWMEATRVCIDEAKKQHMNAWCYDENGWPSGFAGMKLLEDKANWAHYVTIDEGAYDKEALGCYILENNSIKRVFAGEKCFRVWDKTNSSVVDILDPDIVRKFINETHEKYYERFKDDFGPYLLGFFTDEPQYFRWDTAYSPMMKTMYRGRYGRDLLDEMGALFIDCEEAKGFRFRYWRLMNELFTENFAGQIYRWCEEHSCKLTGHAVEESGLQWQMLCCAGIMPFYEYEHIPGVDWLGRDIGTELSPRQVYSAAAQLGKKQILTESYAAAGWDITPTELKRITEWQFVNGVNLLCQHLYPYSIRGQRKRDYPAFYSEHNPWMTEFRKYNDYVSRIGYLLAESKEEAHVGIIHPIHSAYLTFDRHDESKVEKLEKSFFELIEKFGRYNIGHQYIDECLLEKHGYVSGDKLVVGKMAYDIIVIPEMDSLDFSTVELLDEYVDNGGKIYLAGKCPHLMDGEEADLAYSSNIAFEDMLNDKYTISDKNTEIRSTYRMGENCDFLYAVNLSKDKAYDVTYTVKAKGCRLYMPYTDTFVPTYFTTDGEYISIPLHFEKTESFIIMLDGSKSADSPYEAPEYTPLTLDAEITGSVNNILTLDYARYSFDGEKYSERIPVMGINDMMLRGKENRRVYLKYEFDCAYIPEKLLLEAEKMNATSVKVNGKTVDMTTGGIIEASNGVCDIAPLCRMGLNEIVFAIDYYQSDYVYKVHNGVYYEHDDATESLINCMSYITDIEDIYLHGDFGVKANITNGTKTLVSNDGVFTIVKPEKKVSLNALAKSGYPFFSGEISFIKHITATGNETSIKLTGRYSFARIEISGQTRDIMFGDTANIKGMLKEGDNVVKITLITARRNTLGPLHYARDEEPLSIGPGTFNLYGTWDNGSSKAYADRYAFVFFGLDSISIG